MEGILVSLNRDSKEGLVDTRNDEIGILRIYFREIPASVQPNCSVEFELVTSRIGNRYAKFLAVPDRNQSRFNTEIRDQWYLWGEEEEKDFIEKIGPQLDVSLQINPQKAQCPWEIDLIDNTNRRYADLKTQNTPFFTAGKYKYGGAPYDPMYTVTFNKKDFEKYSESYPDCDIYYWVYWTQLAYKEMRVGPLYGVWRAPFARMAEKIRAGEVALHAYQHRVHDDHNAKSSYLFSLTDPTVFQRLIG